MRKSVSAILFVLATAAVVYLHAFPNQTVPPASTPGEAPASENAHDSIKIGYLAALTGEWSRFGQTEIKAARMAVEEINGRGGVLGKPLELVTYDFQTCAQEAVTAVHSMIDEDRVVAIVGANGNILNIATASVVNKAGIPQVGTSSTNPLVTVDENGAVRPYSFRMCFIDPYQGKLMAYFAATKLNLLKAAVVYDDSSTYSMELRDSFIKSYRAYGGTIVLDTSYQGGRKTSFQTEIREIFESGAEVLILPNRGKELGLIIRETAKFGLDVAVIGGDGYGDFIWDIAGNAAEGSFWISHAAPDDPDLQPFFRAYMQKHEGEELECVSAVLGYDAIYLVANAIRQAGEADPQQIAIALADTRELQLHHASMTLDGFHNPVNKEAVIVVASAGGVVFYDKIQPKD